MSIKLLTKHNLELLSLTLKAPPIIAADDNCKFCRFLSQLSRRLRLSLELLVYQLLRRPSVCMSTFSNIFSSETTGLIELKFYMKTPYNGGTKVCSNVPGHMTKMAATPIYGKNPLKIFFSRTRWPMTLGLGM